MKNYGKLSIYRENLNIKITITIRSEVTPCSNVSIVNFEQVRKITIKSSVVQSVLKGH